MARGSIRTASPKLIQRILENARYLRDHPEDAVPQCQGSCPLWCTFRRARWRVKRMHKKRDNVEKLKKMGKRFHPLGKAYSTVLRLAAREPDEIEYLQNVNTPQGKLPIAPWSNAPSALHVGMQHRHEPILRLLSVVPFVSDGEAIFATDTGLVCAHDGRPPEGTLDAILEDLGLERTGPGQARDPRLGDELSAGRLEITWRQADLAMHLAPPKGQTNAMATVQAHMVTPTPLELLSIKVHLPPLDDPSGTQLEEQVIELPDPVVRGYAKGEMSDQDLIQEAHKARAADLRAGGQALVVLGDRIHRPPFEELVERLDPEPPLDEVLAAALARMDRSIVLGRGTAVELLHELWPEVGEEALVEALGEKARELYDPHASLDDLDRLSDQASRHRSRQRVARELPSYGQLPEPIDLVDRVARAYVAGGKQQAQRHLTSAPPRTHQAAALALVRALGLPSPAWTIDPREKDMADLLEPYIEELLEARGEAYHEALQTVLKATGSTQEIEPED